MNIKELLKVTASIAKSRLTKKNHDLNMTSALANLLWYRATWGWHNLDHCPPKGLPEKFMTAREAAGLIKDGQTVISTGIGACSRCSIMYWAVRERYLQMGHPKGLTWVVVAGVGGRGKAPGTIEELALPGLITRHIVGHAETHKAILKMAQEGKMELHVMPQGVLGFLVEAQGRGERTVKSRVGIGSFLDPCTGRGSGVTPNAKNGFITSNGDGLAYTLPELEVAIFSAPYADAEGNLYFKNAAVITESKEAALAAKKNNGLVLVEVSSIIEKNEAEISVPSDWVDAIVVNPRNIQTGAAMQTKYMPMFTEGAQVDVVDAMQLLKLTNVFAGITPHRGPIQDALSRITASLFVDEAKKGDIINLGIGLPEEVGRLLFESGIYKNFVFSTESGVYGGVPSPGIYFGAAVNPEKIMSSIDMFHLYEDKLDITVLGFLQVDSKGNVNVSKRGEHIADYVGPGGFANMVAYAKTIIFIGNWMNGGAYAIKGGQVKITKKGMPKFVDTVDEVTMNGSVAVQEGKTVYYVTSVGVFKLTKEGLLLIRVMPGIDIQKDIVDACSAKIIVPEGKDIPLVDENLITGENFSLALPASDH